MESYNQTTGFHYNPNSDGDHGEVDFSGLLEIYVHHARNIHNICIYDNQDVYAKFSLTYNPDETLSTRIINGGGKNPEFNENLTMKVTQLDAVLKCEIWMLSRARNYMEDQLLGFALVPLSHVAGKGKITQEFVLSSTDLFHSPAGTVQLTLFLNTCISSFSKFSSSISSSITSEVVLLDRKISSQVISDPVEYSRIEFPDINFVNENQQMVTEYFSSPGLIGPVPLLHLGTLLQPVVDDHEMTSNCSEENRERSVSPDGSLQNSGLLSSTTTSLSDDRNSGDSTEKKSTSSLLAGETANTVNASPETPTSKKASEAPKDENGRNMVENQEDVSGAKEEKFSQVFSAPLGDINLEVEQSAMQQQIVEMYMRSTQQFTESLARMKLPMDLDQMDQSSKDDSGGNGQVVIQNRIKKYDVEKRKDGSRVFYGSRAFF
ncbi:C2 domain [Dillenia turbinata]|uniref:C2 domain n=1 Tax=Dillenia turbinata TaxID=194707 RepID=A0AAN8VSB8_9MAGN